MNILIVNKYFFVFGGPERYMFSVIRLLEEKGHKVIPLSLHLDRNQPTPYADYFLPPPFNEQTSHYMQSSLTFMDKIKLTGRAIYYQTARQRVAEIVQRENIDVVYLLNICNYISPSVIDGARQAGARVVMRLSDFNFICASYHLFRDGQVCTDCQNSLYNAIKYRCMRGSISLSLARIMAIKFHQWSGIYQKIDAFVAPSRFMGKTLIKAGMPEERVHWIPSFVNLDEYDPMFIPGQYVLYFGRLDTEKGVDVLLQAWKLLGDNAPPLKIVGSGEVEAALKELSITLDVANVTFHEFVQKSVLLEMIKHAAFVVVPSLWHDNAPMAVYEAMACGKAVVGSKLGGIVDQIEDNVSGILVPANQPDALAQTVQKLWTNKELTKNLGFEARRRMEKYFSPEIHLTKLEKILGDKE